MEEPRKRTKKSKTNSKHKSSSTSTHSADRSVASSDENDEVRRAKLIKSAAKHAQKMAELGLDMNGEPLDNYSLAKYPVREWKLHLPGFQGHIVLNPVVNLIGIVCLWAFVAWVACKSPS